MIPAGDDGAPGYEEKHFDADSKRGSLTVNGCALTAGDAVEVGGEAVVALSDARDAEALLFDLPA